MPMDAEQPKQDENVIRIVLGDEEISSPRELNERQQKALELSRKAIDYFSDLGTKATTVLEYLRAFKGDYLYNKPENIEWMFDYGDVGFDDLLEDIDSDRLKRDLEKDVAALEKMKEKIDRMSPKEGYARVVLKRQRDSSGEVSNYWVLAMFPESSYVMHTGFDKTAGKEAGTEGHAIFYKPSNACTNHACDDIYRSTAEETRGMYYLPLKDVVEAQKEVRLIGGIAEYMLEKTPEGEKVTQDSNNVLTIALLGGFSNEENRVRISDLWKRTGVKF